MPGLTGWVDEYGQWVSDYQNHPASMTQAEYDEKMRNYLDGVFAREEYRKQAWWLWNCEQKRPQPKQKEKL